LTLSYPTRRGFNAYIALVRESYCLLRKFHVLCTLPLTLRLKDGPLVVSIAVIVVRAAGSILRTRSRVGHALKIVTRVADSDRKLLRADLPKRGGPAGLGDHDLPPGIFQPDLAVGGAERIEA
jgi:hypothetical protein